MKLNRRDMIKTSALSAASMLGIDIKGVPMVNLRDSSALVEIINNNLATNLENLDCGDSVMSLITVESEADIPVYTAEWKKVLKNRYQHGNLLAKAIANIQPFLRGNHPLAKIFEAEERRNVRMLNELGNASNEIYQKIQTGNLDPEKAEAWKMGETGYDGMSAVAYLRNRTAAGRQLGVKDLRDEIASILGRDHPSIVRCHEIEQAFDTVVDALLDKFQFPGKDGREGREFFAETIQWLSRAEIQTINTRDEDRFFVRDVVDGSHNFLQLLHQQNQREIAGQFKWALRPLQSKDPKAYRELVDTLKQAENEIYRALTSPRREPEKKKEKKTSSKATGKSETSVQDDPQDAPPGARRQWYCDDTLNAYEAMQTDWITKLDKNPSLPGHCNKR